MPIILAIDPGNTHSAYVLYDVERNAVLDHGKEVNEIFIYNLPRFVVENEEIPKLYVEMIASYGMAVGATVFETCVWIGRFIQEWPFSSNLIYRRDVKLFLCGNPRAKDANIRQAIIDLFGGKDLAIGKKANPGPLYGIKADVWAALAVALTAADKLAKAADAA
jgi:hypothetical protein